MKTSQITAFMLVGIVMLVIFGFMFYVSGELTLSKIDQELDRSMAAVVDNAALQEYIRSCLEDVSKDALRIVTQQSGSIYANQVVGTRYPFLAYQSIKSYYGKQIIPFDDNGILINMTFGIARPLEDRGEMYFEPPNYPYIGSLSFPPPIGFPYQYEEQDYILPKLCISRGANAFKLSEVLGVDSDTASEYDNSCEFSYGPESTQEYLQKYIIEKVKGCIELSAFAEDFGFVFTGTEPEVTVFFGNDHTLVSMNYPFEFAVQGREPITKFYRYNTPFDVRMKKLIIDAKRIIEKDSRDVFFELYRDSVSPSKNCFNVTGQAVRCLDEGMILEKFENVCIDPLSECNEKPNTDVIRITDDLSVIDGEIISFYFAVENRIPALERIDESSNLYFELIMEEGDLLHFKPVGVDPDEDRFGSLIVDGERIMEGFYSYEGWLQDYREEFDIAGCQGNDLCYQNYWEYTNRIEPVSSNPPPIPLMETQLFQTTRRETEYLINASDLGAHRIVIKVCEETGLCDWQELRILVFDQPKAVMDIHHYYLDSEVPWIKETTPEGDIYRGSVEDPFILDASLSTINIGGPIDTFTWRDITYAPGVEFTIYSGNIDKTYYHYLPSISPPPPYGRVHIEDITSHGFTSPGYYNISLAVSANPPPRTDTTSKLIYAEECLPYSDSTKTLIAPPYPYNDQKNTRFKDTGAQYRRVADPFNADHLCCESNYQRSDSNKVCYDAFMFGYYFGFPDFKDPSKYGNSNNVGFNPPTPEPSETAGVGTERWKILNDVYKLNINRYCDTRRGNTCQGGGGISFDPVEQCNTEYNDQYFSGFGGQQQRCEGPHTLYQYFHWKDNLHCTTYSGNTFDGLFLGESGICDEKDLCDGDNWIQTWTCGDPKAGDPNPPGNPLGRYGCSQVRDVKNCNDFNGCYRVGDPPQDNHPDLCTDPNEICENRDYTCVQGAGLDSSCGDPRTAGDDDNDLWQNRCDRQDGNACGKTTTSDQCDSVGTFGCMDQDSSKDYCTRCDGNYVWLDNSPDQFPDPSFETGKCCGDTDGASITSKYKSATYVACCNPAAGHTCTARTGSGLDCFAENDRTNIGINCVECQASGNWADCPPPPI